MKDKDFNKKATPLYDLGDNATGYQAFKVAPNPTKVDIPYSGKGKWYVDKNGKAEDCRIRAIMNITPRMLGSTSSPINTPTQSSAPAQQTAPANSQSAPTNST
jgi:hypothetical protein